MESLPKRRPARGRRSAIGSAMRILRGQLEDPSPEERLWLAVIEHAVRDAYAARESDDKAREEALQWIDSEEFEEVAISLGLHPRWARETIKKIPAVGETH